jgi:hypothetical protein
MEEYKTEVVYWAGRLIGYDQAWEVAEEIVDTIKKAQAQALGSTLVCKICKGRKKVPIFDEYDSKLKGSTKCWECNGGIYPVHWMDNY